MRLEVSMKILPHLKRVRFSAEGEIEVERVRRRALERLAAEEKKSKTTLRRSMARLFSFSIQGSQAQLPSKSMTTGLSSTLKRLASLQIPK
jgi:hypothetical protein